MHLTPLKQLKEWLENQISPIGSGLRQRATQLLALNRSPCAVQILAKALTRSNDPQVRAIALDALHQIETQECINRVCAVWIATRHTELATLLVEKGWMASAPVEVKVLSALKTGQLEVVTDGRAEIVEPLLKACSDVDSEIASRASQCASAIVNLDAINYLCERWSKTRDRLFEQLLLQGKYVALKPIQLKVLCALKVERLEVITKSGKEVIEPLIEALSDSDREITHRADRCIAALKNPDAIDYLCEKWANTRNKHLAQAIVQQGYVARKPIEVRVLSALKAGQQAVVIKGGAEIVEPLCNALSDASWEISSRAKQYANNLVNSDAIDNLCEKWANTRTRLLEQVILQGGYVAQKPIRAKVLSALKVGKIEALINGGKEVVELLLQACKDVDSDIAQAGQLVLRKLKNPEAQEFLCNLVIEQDHQLAREVVVDSQYMPRDSKQRALFLFLTQQWDKYESLDFDRTLLQTAYEIGDKQLRQRIAQEISQAGRAEWVQILAGGHQGKRLGEMTHDEWETALEILNNGQKWEKMWQLAQAAPPKWSADLLHQLNAAQWIPQDRRERTGFEELTFLAQYGQVECLNALEEHTDLVSCLAFSSDGQTLATGSQDKTVLLWDWQETTMHLLNWQEAVTRGVLKQHDHWVVCLAISSDSKLLVTGSRDNKVRLWQLTDGKLLKTLTGHRDWVMSLAISPDSKLLVTGSGDRTVCLRSLPNGKFLKKIKAHDSFVRCLAIGSDGTLLVTGSDDKTIKLWTLPNGNLVKTLTWDCGVVRCLAISPNGQLLVAGIDNTVRIWCLPSGEQWKTLQGHTQEVMCLAIAPGGQWLATGGMDKKVRLWSLVDGSLLKTLSQHAGEVRSLAISPDGRYLATGSKDRTVRLWTGQWLRQEYLPNGELDNMTLIQKALRNQSMVDEKRGWLEFSKALLRWRKQFDIEVEEVSQRIDAGEFDIEIEG